MKIFQTIHKYPPHIPEFEKKNGITDATNITFEELRKLIVEDGYASCYILQPALEHKTDEVFYTIWDYERLQYLWAKENGVASRDLSEIKLAQLEKFKPDVFYNLSPFRDHNLIELIKIRGIKCKTICWNSLIVDRPMTFPLYDVHLTLHEPYLDYWKKLGLKSFELQPAIPDFWDFENQNRAVDVLFYGQYFESMFSQRNRLIEKLVSYKNETSFKMDIHLQYKIKKHVQVKFLKYKKTVINYPPQSIVNATLKPLYGSELYDKIANSKIVVNAYGDFNNEFKSNMRVFESIGHGAFLISEKGNYPKGLTPDVDFYTYENFEELTEKIDYVLSNWEAHSKLALKTARKVRSFFSKEKQWQRFQEIVASVSQ